MGKPVVKWQCGRHLDDEMPRKMGSIGIMDVKQTLEIRSILLICPQIAEQKGVLPLSLRSNYEAV
jgi:hypothetical protein